MKIRTPGIIVAALMAGVAACSDPVTATISARSSVSNSSSGSVLVECPTDQRAEGAALITPLGGVVSAGGTSISIPAGAVVAPTYIRVVVPASKYMEVDITADGSEHFSFESPVTVSMSYARCTRSDINKAPLSVWYIDSQSKALLQNMGGSDDKVNRSVTFVTDHLSGYAVAN